MLDEVQALVELFGELCSVVIVAEINSVNAGRQGAIGRLVDLMGLVLKGDDDANAAHNARCN